MRDSKIGMSLFLTLLVMTALPLIAALYFADRALQTSLDLGFNPQIARALENQSRNLRLLKNTDPANADSYRAQFDEVQELKHVYASPDLIKTGVRRSLIIYFAIGLVATILTAVLVATALSRNIARGYARAFEELHREKARVRYLEEMSSWQELAKMLAHEIKNPLTPIEVLVTSLSKAYLAQPQAEFAAHLRETQTMISEELAHLKNTVSKFSEFAKLPAVQLAEEDVPDVIRQHLKAIGAQFDNAELTFECTDCSEPVRARIDSTLFRQALMNIVRNGVEANLPRKVRFAVAVEPREDRLVMSLTNDGEPVPEAIADRIFDPYVSGKSGQDNMGLGLAIVKKIIIEHGGDVSYRETAGKPSFVISLPRVA